MNGWSHAAEALVHLAGVVIEDTRQEVNGVRLTTARGPRRVEPADAQTRWQQRQDLTTV